MSTVPPIGAVRVGAREEEKNKRRFRTGIPGGIASVAAPVVEGAKEIAGMSPEERRRAGVLGTAYRGAEAGAREAGRQAGEIMEVAGGAKRAVGEFLFGTPASTGDAKRSENEAQRSAAHQAARTRAPEGQPDNRPVTRPTATGSGGPVRLAEGTPTTETGEVDPTRFGEHGSITVHSRGPDPALQPGGFAHPASRRDPLEDLPERGTMTYGPKGATGGHSWTRRTPGRQEAMYDRARYQQEVRARQAQEEAAIGELDARAATALANIARSKELEEDPFAPEKATVAAAVGEQVAKARPEREAMDLAISLGQQLEERIAQIRSDPNLDDTTRETMIREAKDLFWSYLAGIRPQARKPREEIPYLAPETEE